MISSADMSTNTDGASCALSEQTTQSAPSAEQNLGAPGGEALQGATTDPAEAIESPAAQDAGAAKTGARRRAPRNVDREKLAADAREAVELGRSVDPVSTGLVQALGGEVVSVHVQRLNPDQTVRETGDESVQTDQEAESAHAAVLDAMASGEGGISAGDLPAALTVTAVPRTPRARMTPERRSQARRDAKAALRDLGASLRGFRIEVPFCLVTPVMTSVYRNTWAEYLTATDRLTAHAIGTLGRKDGYEFMDRVMAGLHAAKEIVAVQFEGVESEWTKAAKMKSKWRITDASTPMLNTPIVLTNALTKGYLECLMQMDTTLQRAYSLLFLEVRDQLDLEHMEVKFRDLCYRTVRAVVAGINALHNAQDLKEAIANFERSDRTKKAKPANEEGGEFETGSAAASELKGDGQSGQAGGGESAATDLGQAPPFGAGSDQLALAA